MDKISIFDKNYRLISKDKMSPLASIIYNEANQAAFKLSANYKKQNQRVEITIKNEKTGDYNMNFFNCTKKYSCEFNRLFQQQIKSNYNLK